MPTVSGVWSITELDLVLRMFIAAVLGGAIGFEREFSDHAAGFRTHILVCLGSCAIMLLSIYGFSEFVGEGNVRIDPARLAAQVVSGIGFLGAGAILRNGDRVTGLTTAASVWTVAAIGLCVGAGFYLGAVVCTIMVLISLYLLNKLEKAMLRKRRTLNVKIGLHDRNGALGKLIHRFGEKGVELRRLQVVLEPAESPEDSAAGRTIRVSFQITSKHLGRLVGLFEEISANPDVIAMETETPSGPHRKREAAGRGFAS